MTKLFKPNEIGKAWTVKSRFSTAWWSMPTESGASSKLIEYGDFGKGYKLVEVAIVPLRIWRKILKELKEKA